MHDYYVGALADRLAAKGRFPYHFVPVRDLEGRLVSDADLLDVDFRDGFVHVTRYEVKTGRRGWRDARHQAASWYALFDGIGYIKPRFVYYNPVAGVARRVHC